MGFSRRKIVSFKKCEEIKKGFEEYQQKFDVVKQVLPPGVEEDRIVREVVIDGCKCYNIIPKKDFSGKYIFYIYGSTFGCAMSKKQWEFISEMAKNANMGMLIPIYPLPPLHGCKEAVNMLMHAYKDLGMSNDAEKIIIMGDSDGACYALSLCIQIWKNGYRKPSKLILLSPILDTEFFDKELEEKVEMTKDRTFEISTGFKDYVNEYWIRESAADTDITSPIYGDFTDLCDSALVISASKDRFLYHARKFYEKAVQAGLRVQYFEYKGLYHNFIFDKKLDETKHVKKVMLDVLLDSTSNIFHKYMHEIKRRTLWSKKYPEVFKDDYAAKYLSNTKIKFDDYKAQNDFREFLAAARQKSFDDGVKKFLMEYPNGTVVHIGCSLDTMMKRTDNGRVKWFNCDTPGTISVRRMYTKDEKREITIDKSINDPEWLKSIDCDMGDGLLFVCSDFLPYMTQEDVREFMEQLYINFPGCQVLFDVASYTSIVSSNIYNRGKDVDFRKRKFYMNNPDKGVLVWNTAFRVISQGSILDGIETDKAWKAFMKFKVGFVKRFRNYKIVHLKLGYVKYKTGLNT